MKLKKINEHFFPGLEIKNQSFLYLNGDVTAESTAAIIQEIIAANMEKEIYEDVVLLNEGEEDALAEALDGVEEPEQVINLFINSPGGDGAAAFSLISMIEASDIPVRTIALGEAGSAGLMILMAGHQRVATEYSSILSHQFSTGTEGTYADVKKSMVEFDNCNAKILAFYEKNTGLTKARIKKTLLLDTNTWLTPEQALKFGLIDLVTDLK